MIGKSAKGDRGGVGVTGDVRGNVNIGIDASVALEAKDELIANLKKQLNERTEMLNELRKADAGKHQAEITLLQQQITELQRRLDNPDQALQEAKATITKLENALTREGNDIGEARMTEARNALEAGDFSIADDIFAVIEAREQLAVERAARAAFARGEIAQQEIRWADAAKHYARAAQLNPTYENLQYARGFTNGIGDYDKAVALGNELIKVAESKWGKNSKYFATALNDHALTIIEIGKIKEAEQLHIQAIDIWDKNFDTNHPDYASLLNNLACVYREKGTYNLAEPLYKKVLEIYKKTIGTGKREYVYALNNLAGLYRTIGKYDQAILLYEQNKEIGKLVLGADQPSYAIGLHNLANCYAATGELALAKPLYLQAIRTLESALGPDSPTTINVKIDYKGFLNNHP